jgi:hypothetical protein
LGARIDFKLIATGSHNIVVTEQFNDQSVNYTLSLERLVPPSNSAPQSRYGLAASEDINTVGDVDLRWFNGSAGTVVTLIASREAGAVPCVELWAPAGGRIGGPACSTLGARIDATLNTTGVYVVRLSEQFNDQTVSYSIDLQCVSGQCPRSLTA